MKKCSYCGAKYGDQVVECPVDHTSLANPGAVPPVAPKRPSETPKELDQFTPLLPENMGSDLVTLLRCENLASADLVVSRLEAAGIAAFIPDENLMQVIGFNLNTFGYVRVRVSPKDYEGAKAVLGRADA